MRMVAVLASASACSYFMREAPSPLPAHGDPACSDGIGPPVVDTIGAVVTGIVAATFAFGDPMTEGPQRGTNALAYGAIAAGFALSAVHGYRVGSRCRSARTTLAERDQQRDAREHEERPRRAAQLVGIASVAARAGDCEAVVRLEATVRWIDEDVRATVFARDEAIAACLRGPIAAPALPPPLPAPPPPPPTSEPQP